MTTNVTHKYLDAESEFHKAETTSDKLKALKKMLATAPTHKGAQKMRSQIKKQIAKYRELAKKEKKSGKGKSYSISKEGAAQITIIGPPNSGKSTLLSKLSGKKVPIAEYEFTTKEPEMRMIPFENVWIQAIELPAIYPGYHDSKQGRQMLSLLRNSDFVLVVLENRKNKKDNKLIRTELKAVGIELGAKRKYRDGFSEHIPSITIGRKEFDRKHLVLDIWKRQHKIRIQTKADGKIAKKPIVLKEGETVEIVAKHIHKDFVKNFRFAKIWGPSAKFAGQQVGLEHKLKDKDIVEIFTK